MLLASNQRHDSYRSSSCCLPMMLNIAEQRLLMLFASKQRHDSYCSSSSRRRSSPSIHCSCCWPPRSATTLIARHPAHPDRSSPSLVCHSAGLQAKPRLLSLFVKPTQIIVELQLLMLLASKQRLLMLLASKQRLLVLFASKQRLLVLFASKLRHDSYRSSPSRPRSSPSKSCSCC
jgi:hypothetical protein